MNARILSTALTLALAAMSVLAGSAAATAPTPASGSIWNQNQRVEFRWHEGDEPPTWMRAAATAAAQDSTDSRASKAGIFVQSDSGTSWIGYTGDIPTNWAIGYTVSSQPGTFSMRLRPQGYPLDWGTLRWCQFYDSPPLGCYDAEMIALHELGHAQSLSHPDDADVTDWTDTVMHASPKTKAKAGWNAHEFGRCDVARLQIRYEPLTSSTRYSTCLDLDTDLTLSVSATNLTSNSALTLTARLAVAGDVIWPNLANEPVSSRAVIIQRRAPGGTSWSDVGSMGFLDDNGRYAKTLNVTDTYDYRAVFATPSNEGLNGATSLSVRVNVSSSGGTCSNAQSGPRPQMLPVC
jgi:hypothetical protein